MYICKAYYKLNTQYLLFLLKILIYFTFTFVVNTSVRLMQEFFLKYIAQCHKVTIGNLGTFTVQATQPIYQGVAQQYTAYKQDITFVPHHKADTCNAFITYLAEQLTYTKQEATAYILNQVQYIYITVAKQGYDEWAGMGIFKNDGNGTLTFVPNDYDNYSPILQVTKAIHANDEHTIQVGEQLVTNTTMQEYYNDLNTSKPNYWWIAPLTLGLLTIAYIVYYHIISN